MSHNYDYDAIIIGAGIGGLVCGCYLAKAGMKVLIVEKNAKVGGYCTSFSRGGFKFDACVHSLGSLRGNGILRIIMEELSLMNEVNFMRHNPQDIIITPDGNITFWNEIEKTIADFQQRFPQEAVNIKRFFDFVLNCNGVGLIQIQHITFRELIDRYFSDKKIKSVLSFPVLGDTGMSASISSAFTAVALYKEFILDGGYYPNGTIQKFPDALLVRFREYGGEILCSSLASKIRVKDNCIDGVEVNRNDFMRTRYVISDIDAMQTFFGLLDGENIAGKTKDVLKSLKPSLSIFVLYLGMDVELTDIPANTNIWVLADYNIETSYHLACSGEVEGLNCFVLRLAADKKSIVMFVNAPFRDNEYWKENKNKLIDIFIKKIAAVIPDVSCKIVFKDAATPSTLHRWTLNYKGAAYGWEGTPSQFAIAGLSPITEVKNLYLTGHWSTLAQGVSGVARLGRNIAGVIINRERI